MQNIIQFNHVSKSFDTPSGQYHALKDIQLDIAKGEHIAIVGKSGSGKSTLLNMLTGIDHPSQGGVSMNGVSLSTLNESQLAQWRGKNIGIVFQFFQLIPTLSVLENLLLAMDFVDVIPKNLRRQRAQELLERVDIAAHANKYPAALSGGEQQRAAIARALANDPDILVADEPTGNLDSKTSAAIHKIFSDLASNGKTVIVVTHEELSNAGYQRILTLQDGAIVSDRKALS